MRNTEGEGDLMLLRVREFRQRARLSQAALATQSHCSRELISAIENDRHSPNVRLLYRIAGALHVPLWSLFNDQEPDDHLPPTGSRAS